MQQDWTLTYQNIPSTRSDTVPARKIMLYETEDARLKKIARLIVTSFNLFSGLCRFFVSSVSLRPGDCTCPFPLMKRDLVTQERMQQLQLRVRIYLMWMWSVFSFKTAKQRTPLTKFLIFKGCASLLSVRGRILSSRVLKGWFFFQAGCPCDNLWQVITCSKAVVEGETGCSTTVGTLRWPFRQVLSGSVMCKHSLVPLPASKSECHR